VTAVSRLLLVIALLVGVLLGTGLALLTIFEPGGLPVLDLRS
jgi:hypothetical protein